jgi:hypothetical protein
MTTSDGGWPFTAENLREIIEDVLSRRYNPPSSENLELLARGLNSITNLTLAARIAKVVAAESGRYCPNHFERDINGMFFTYDKWQWEHIALMFQLAMKSTNPGIMIKYSNEGPVARFVAAVLPMVTLDRPAVGYVSQRLKMAAREE